MTSTTALFDAQRDRFDQRAGLPSAVCPEIAAQVLRFSESSRHIVDMGAGTGQIGVHLATKAPYLALDRSFGMLAVFRRRRAATSLAVADGTGPWPLADGSASLIFSSRAIHWLPPKHAANEAIRVAPAGVLLIGRTRREPHDIRSRMRRGLHERMREAGLSPRAGRNLGQRLCALCREAGGEDLPPVTAARWPVTSTPRRALDAWRKKPGLGGVATIRPAIKERVLDELSAWAERTLGGLDEETTAEETYVLEGVRLPEQGVIV